METKAQRVVLIADHPHGDRVDRELRSLGHEVTYVQDAHGAGILAVHRGIDWVIAMILHHSESERLKEKARQCGVRFVHSPLGWAHCRERLQREGFPLSAQIDLMQPEPVAALALVPEAEAARAPFAFEGHGVEVIAEEGGPLFLAADVCERCGIADVSQAMERVAPIGKVLRNPPSRVEHGLVHPPPPRPRWYVNEGGLNELVMASRKPEAERFKRWIAYDVLPSIRRTGSYSAAPPESDDIVMARGLLVASERIKQLQAKNQTLEADNAEKTQAITLAAPKVAFHDQFANAEGLTGMRAAGRILTGHPDKWIDSLKGEFVFYEGGDLVPYAEYGEGGRGLFAVRVTTVKDKDGNDLRVCRRTYVTAKGMQFFAAQITSPAMEAHQ